MKISWIIQSNILTSSAVSCARGSDWREQLRRPCLLSKTKRTGSVFLWSLLREHLLFVFPSTHSNLPAAPPRVLKSHLTLRRKPNMRLPWACLVRAHAWLCVQASCAGRQPRSSAVYPILCSLRLVDRAPTAVVLMRLADYCCPSPTSTSPPFLSGRQPCRPSVANPAQAGLGRTIDTHTHIKILCCVCFILHAAWMCGTRVQLGVRGGGRKSFQRPSRQKWQTKGVCYCCFWICPTFSSLTCASSSAIKRLSGTGSSFLSCSSLRSTIPLNEAIGICASVALIPGPRVFYCACQWWVTDELQVHRF